MKEHFFQMDTERDHAVYQRPPLDHYCDIPVLVSACARSLSRGSFLRHVRSKQDKGRKTVSLQQL